MAWAMAVCGCAAATAPEMISTTKPTDTGRDDVRSIEQDPVGYLRECLQRSRQMHQYTLLLYRQERLGLIPQLQPPEYIRVMYRADPLSIKMIWSTLSSMYGEFFQAGRVEAPTGHDQETEPENLDRKCRWDLVG